jgi:hypothetical protein
MATGAFCTVGRLKVEHLFSVTTRTSLLQATPP